MNILIFWNVYTFQKKGIYILGKNIILSKKKVYTFLEKSIYFFGEKYILFSERNNYFVYI